MYGRQQEQVLALIALSGIILPPLVVILWGASCYSCRWLLVTRGRNQAGTEEGFDVYHLMFAMTLMQLPACSTCVFRL